MSSLTRLRHLDLANAVGPGFPDLWPLVACTALELLSLSMFKLDIATVQSVSAGRDGWEAVLSFAALGLDEAPPLRPLDGIPGLLVHLKYPDCLLVASWDIPLQLWRLGEANARRWKVRVETWLHCVTDYRHLLKGYMDYGN